MENLDKITETLGGYPIIDLRHNKRDNLFVGRVKDPICGRPDLHNGYITVLWNLRGKVIERYGGNKRSDLFIDIKLITR